MSHGSTIVATVGLTLLLVSWLVGTVPPSVFIHYAGPGGWRQGPVSPADVAIHHGGSEGMSLYDYYRPGGAVTSGLEAEGETFTLNGKDLLILSGAMHYFRVHPDHWRDTLKKLRAAGLNAVETYVPWNLHEPRQGEYDFGDGGEPMSAFLDVRAFIQMAQEEDLLVLLRPGPYICGEWDFGGMPSFLLRDPAMQVRTYYENYRTAAGNYFDHLLPRLADLQFTKGGPIIAVQIENEYGHFGYGEDPRDKQYLTFLRDNLVDNGFGESLFFTSDTPTQTGDLGGLDGVLMTANFKTGGEKELATLKALQPTRPLMVMEFWTGWFDHWLAENHVTWDPAKYAENLEMILQHNSSVNLYMFIGGTNWGFMAGANTLDVWPKYAADVTSYDYDAILSEAGDYTEKYSLTRDILAKYNPLQGVVDHPEPPAPRAKTAYPACPLTDTMDLSALLPQLPHVVSTSGVMSMEELPINGGNGQAHGYTMYITFASLQAPESVLKIRGHVRDMAQVFMNAVEVTKPLTSPLDVNGFGYWNGYDKELSVPSPGGTQEISILVENLGRVNYGAPHKYHQKKGLWEGPVLVDGAQLDEWQIFAIEFKNVSSLSGWTPYGGALGGPGMYRGQLEVTGPAQDTWLDMRGWNKGVVVVNDFVLGRYWNMGPPQTLYLPGPLLKEGTNQIVVFEQYEPGTEIKFSDVPILSGTGRTQSSDVPVLA